ncbi:hypothetical protein GGQ64_005360 [Rhizobium azooxidifex]|uniref:Uncharacterized protein n=1 Tax=Mycoplana azooxidifex TaxID=1636188 RepID=A0A7W6DHU6_9HYPH|nr:hypothetical protein [Mycoplana azooxidifex]MBB3980113.1 hypothetical protein [Mycoplana azooxidifex]
MHVVIRAGELIAAAAIVFVEAIMSPATGALAVIAAIGVVAWAYWTGQM